MRTRYGMLLRVAALCVVTAGMFGSAEAWWYENGTGVCTASDHQLYVNIIRSEDGTFIATWHDKRSNNFDIWAQKFDIHGNPLWTQDGVLVQENPPIERYPKLVTDGAGGAIILWEDFRAGMDLYAQRIDAGGNKLWSTYGNPVCTQTGDQHNASMIPDGAGGAIIVWEDWRSYPTYIDIYIQRLDGNGNPLWTVNGETVCATSTENRQGPVLVTDGSRGAIVAWYESRSGSYDILAQRISSAGTRLWADNGNIVCSAAQNQWRPCIVSDGFEGAIIAWQDYRSGTRHDIYAQRITLAGEVRWTVNGVAICAAAGNKGAPVIATDGAAGAIVAWTDLRSGTGWTEIYAQRIDVLGAAKWTADGVPVCTAVGDKLEISIDADGQGGALLAWRDNRAFGGDIYAQRIGSGGAPVWATDGVAVCKAEGVQEVPKIVSDCEGGAIIAWHDWRSGQTDVYAQRIERSGYWGYPAPRISGVRDVPGDQGGYVNLSWDASRLDPWPHMLITRYTLWRAIDPIAALLLADAGALITTSAADEPEHPGAPLIRREIIAGEVYYWYLTDEVDAYHLSSYSAPVPTMFDSTASSNEHHYFQVIAHTADAAVFWTSAPDSGYSVDNLAPCQPLGLAGEQSYLPEGLMLTWDPNTEPDLKGYAVFRGLAEDFTPEPANLLAAPCDTFFFDEGWRWHSGYYYKLAAVDVHGNMSGFALLRPGEITSDEKPTIPPASFLAQNVPNPFNPATTIRFGLSEPGRVTLRIYDAAGRLVRVLADEHRQAGRYDAEWNGRDGAGRAVSSGVYFYKLSAGGFSETKKMVLLR